MFIRTQAKGGCPHEDGCKVSGDGQSGKPANVRHTAAFRVSEKHPIEKEKMSMKKVLSAVLIAILVLCSTVALADSIQIAVPNDATNEGRALLLLESNGIIKLSEEAGITATAADIVENPLNIEFVEVEAAMVPNVLVDVDYAIINNNYALDAGLNPVEQSLLIENADSPYGNVLSVKEGNEELPEIKALVAALTSQKVADYINETYAGAAISVVAEPTDGFDATVDYDALSGKTITVAASPTPHAQILAVAAEILAEKNITLNVLEFTDYIIPNEVVESGEALANYFAHDPYQQNFNQENGTHLVTVAVIHVEPMGLYGGKQTTLDAVTGE